MPGNHLLTNKPMKYPRIAGEVAGFELHGEPPGLGWMQRSPSSFRVSYVNGCGGVGIEYNHGKRGTSNYLTVGMVGSTVELHKHV